jgi:hypothetical protein
VVGDVMKRIVIAFIVAIGLLIPSWFCAILWRENDIDHRPQALMNVLERVMRPLLSSEAWLAEEQLDFWSYWIPIYFIFVLGFLCTFKLWNMLSSNLNNGRSQQ